MAHHGDNKNISSKKQILKGITYFERPVLTINDEEYQRFAIQTHFISRGESYLEICQKYVKPLVKENDMLLLSEKIVSMCQDNTVEIEDVKLGWWAKNLSKLATSNDAGIGMDEPYKLQLAINIAGLPRILFAVFCGAVGKILKKDGWFYKVAGHGIAGIDGFYKNSSFEIYHTLAILNPLEPDKVCEELYQELGIACVIADANDYGQEILGSYGISDEEHFLKTIKDNPAGQDDELTPLVLIRKQ